MPRLAKLPPHRPPEAEAMSWSDWGRPMMLKGFVVEKGSDHPTGLKRTVNEEQWARAMVANLTCQERVDVKAFTGRGSQRELRHLVDKLEAIEASMQGLSTASKALPACNAYLVVHHRTASGYTFLRWRERAGASRHVRWDDVDSILAVMPDRVRAWCSEAGAQAQALNAEHLAVREAIKVVRRSLLQKRSHLLPRALPEFRSWPP